MRAVYVPAPVVPGDASYMVATASPMEGGGTLTVYSATRAPLGTTRLQPERLRQVLREWATADRAGRGRLALGN